jgi:uncharacterized membrane protein YdjX (TVP38/TMEM64 family)
MTKEQKKLTKKLIGSAVVIALFVGAVYLVFYLLGWTNLTREQLQTFITQTGVVAPIVYIFISFLQVTIVPIPAAITILAGNYVFGAVGAFIYSYIGTLLGGMFAFLLGKWLGKPFVNWLSGGQEETDKWLKKLKGKENVLLFFMFLFPFFPDDLLCSVAGILPISWLGFFLMLVVTRATSAGGTILFMSGEIIPFHGWGLIVFGIVGVVGIAAFIICFKHSAKINEWYEGLLYKISNWKIFRRKNGEKESADERSSQEK